MLAADETTVLIRSITTLARFRPLPVLRQALQVLLEANETSAKTSETTRFGPRTPSHGLSGRRAPAAEWIELKARVLAAKQAAGLSQPALAKLARIKVSTLRTILGPRGVTPGAATTARLESWLRKTAPQSPETVPVPFRFRGTVVGNGSAAAGTSDERRADLAAGS